MQCPRCQADNREGRRFCVERGASLALPCSACGFSNEPGEKFCGGCGIPLTSVHRTPEPRLNSPRSYTPKHLAEQVLACRAAVVITNDQELAVTRQRIQQFQDLLVRLRQCETAANYAAMVTASLLEIDRMNGEVRCYPASPPTAQAEAVH